MSQTPPPLPPGPTSHVPYATPGPAGTDAGSGDGGAQRVFDTVVGPNLRLRDNLIQLLCVAVGAVVGAFVARLLFAGGDPAGPMLLGAVGGALGALLLSGVVIGIVRGVQGARRR